MRTLSQMRRVVQQMTKVGDNDDLLDELFNLEYDRLIRAHRWRELEDSLDGVAAAALSTTAGVNYLALPHDALRPLALSDTTNDWPLIERSTRQHIIENVARIDQNSSVVYYSHFGTRATKRPLSADDTIQILAEQSADINIDCRITGRRSDVDLVDRETISTNSADGTTAVTSANSYRKGWSIQGISIQNGTTGYIRVRETTTAANVLAEVSEHQRVPRYPVVILENPPEASSNIAVAYKRRPPDLIDDDDAPLIPVENALIEYAIGKIRQRDRSYEESQFHMGASDVAVSGELAQRRLDSGQLRQIHPDYTGRLERRARARSRIRG